MATLKAQNFDLELSYYDVSGCNEIIYSLEIKLNGEPFFNPQIIAQTNTVKNGKFIISDCWEGEDWLHNFFIDILKTKKGNSYTTTEPPEWGFEAITWEDQRAEKEKSWEGKTVKTKNEKDEIIDVPYAEMTKLFIPLWENNIEFKIKFPGEELGTQEHTVFSLSLTTTFFDLTKFLEDFGKEMNRFYAFFSERIRYMGEGKFHENEDFKYKDISLDGDVYQIKRCAEWNNEDLIPDNEIVLELLLTEIYVHSYCIVGTTRYILDSSVREELAKEIFILAEERLTDEKDEETLKKLEAIKSVIAIAYPAILTNAQRSNALSSMSKNDVPEEIFERNKTFYPQHLKA